MSCLPVALGVLAPEPDVGELVGEDRVDAQVGLDQPLELGALVRLRDRRCDAARRGRRRSSTPWPFLPQRRAPSDDSKTSFADGLSAPPPTLDEDVVLAWGSELSSLIAGGGSSAVASSAHAM